MFDPHQIGGAIPTPPPLRDERRERDDRNLRDQFAMEAMTMIFNDENAAWEWESDDTPDVYEPWARQAYYLADAMMKARKAQRTP